MTTPPTDPYDQCVAVLRPLWKGLDVEYKRKYALTIWTQFEHAVVRAGHRETLSAAMTALCSRLPIHALREGLDVALAVVRGGQDRDLLRLWRTEATTLVLMLRVEAEETRSAKASASDVARREAETDRWQVSLDASATTTEEL